MIREYSELRREFLKNRRCQLCHEMATEIHHSRGRWGRFLIDTQYWIAICRKHHNLAHHYPAKARELGLFGPRGTWLSG